MTTVVAMPPPAPLPSVTNTITPTAPPPRCRTLMAALVMSILTLLVYTVGMASPFWFYLYVEQYETEVSLGLWQGCFQGLCLTLDAFGFVILPLLFTITRILICVAMGMMVIASLSLFAAASNSRQNKRCLILLAGLLNFFAGLTAASGVAVFALMFWALGLSWAFMMCAVGSLLAIISAIVAFVARCRASDQPGMVLMQGDASGYPPNTVIVAGAQPSSAIPMQYYQGQPGQPPAYPNQIQTVAYPQNGQMVSYPTMDSKLANEMPPAYE